MGKKACGPRAIDKVEAYICTRPKLSVITPSLVERDTGLDHRQAETCLDSLAPHPGQASIYELCEETGQGRWLIKSTVNHNQYWIDEPDMCIIEAIRKSDKKGLSIPQKQANAQRLGKKCSINIT
jgi:hypothetical protein